MNENPIHNPAPEVAGTESEEGGSDSPRIRPMSLGILLACILMPPVLFVATLGAVETTFQNRYRENLEAVFLGDTQTLFSGATRIQDVVEENVEAFVESRDLTNWGARLLVTVATDRGRMLYPRTFSDEDPADTPLIPDPTEVAEENYRILQENPAVRVELSIGYATPFSAAVLSFYILIAAGVLVAHYRTASRRARLVVAADRDRIRRLTELKSDREEKLQHLEAHRSLLSEELERLKNDYKKERDKASRNEEEMLQDLIGLEEKMEANLRLQDEQKEELETLRETLQRFEQSKKRKRTSEVLAKRFRVLYKAVSVHPKALDGYEELTEEMKIKCEEIIHLLNENPQQVSIKRKVFTKKSRETVLEVKFSHKGRLYFRNLDDGKIEVLGVGTKNTQSRELGFIDSL